ncbi:hypothetical protein [Caballeronia temeraria]|nr:hypothetical protein [Caballeronia temeraria]
MTHQPPQQPDQRYSWAAMAVVGASHHDSFAGFAYGISTLANVFV